jgi:hypothetical protein
LTVLAEPAGAEVVVDGQARGRSPLTLTLPAGDHLIALTAAGYEPFSETLTLFPGQEGIYTPALRPAAPPPTAAASRTAAPPPPPTRAATAASSHTATPMPSPTAPPAPAATTSLIVTEIALLTYPFGPFLRPESDPAHGDYPLTVLDRAAYQASNPRPQPITYTLVVLENRYLRLSILPDLGGRVYECVFKPTGNNEFYRNPVIKPTGWGPPSPPYPAGANWWLAAGGLEWGFPVEEHGYEWAQPWGFIPADLSDGGVQVTVLTREFRRPYVSVDIILPPESAAFTIRPRIVNPLGAAFRFKWWANAMLAPGAANKPGPELRFIFPTGEMTVHSTGDPALPGPGQPFAWPVHAGRDLSRLGNWSQYLGFFQRPAAAGGYMGVYDAAADEGLLRIYPPGVARGAKGFAMGWANPIGADNWTDDGSGYVELHGGLAPTFDDWYELPPGGQVTWSETWYPAAGIGGVTYAAAGGALNLAPAGGALRVAVFPTAAVRGQLKLTVPGLAPIDRSVEISPARPFNEQLALPAAAPAQGEVSLALTDGRGEVALAWRGMARLR